MKKLEIKEEDLIYNLNLIKNKLSKKSDIIAVVKANGMGLGLLEYAEFLRKQGINNFGVANVDEAIILRENGITENILMMSEVYNYQELTDLINNDIILTIGSLDEKILIDEISKTLQKKVKVNVKVDTGFSRYRFYI